MEPNPSEVSPWYLRNITQALALDEATGQVYVRTGITGDVYITGPVTIPGTITVNSSPEDPVHVHINEIGTSGVLDIPNMPISIQDAAGNANSNTYPVYVSGSVNIGTMPEVEIKNDTGNPVPVSGSVNIGTMPEVEIKNDSGNPISVSKNTSTNSQTNPIYVEGVNNASFFAPTQSDSFGRLRVSNPQTLFDVQSRYYDHQQFATNTVGGATVVYNANSSTYSLNVGTGGTDSAVTETFKVFPYQPGKSLLIYTTFCMGVDKPNLRQRVGYFGENNGVYFENDAGTYNMVIRSKSSGSIVEDRIPRNQWNGDRLNGLGGVNNPSGITLDVALDQIFWIDIEWLGVGSVRTGFVIDGNYIVCHTFNHANTPSVPGSTNNTTTYMTTACLPVRYEITNTGVTSGASTLRQVCASVISEGGYQLTGIPRSIGHTLGSPTTLPDDASFLPLMSIRLKSAMPDAIVLPKFFTIAPVAQSTFKYRIYSRATTTGGTWIPVDGAFESPVEYNLAPTAVTSGAIVTEGFIVSSNQTAAAPSQASFGFEVQLQRNPFTGVTYEYVLAAATTGTNQKVYASIEWQEVS